MRVIGVMPAYNEGARITDALHGCLRFVDRIIVVDDGSSDDTVSNAAMDRVVVLRHAINRGQGAALRTGTEAALRMGADVIIHLDADGQHDPENIPNLIRPLMDDKADIVFGSRFMGIEPTGMPFARRMLLKAGKVFSTLVLGIPAAMTDPQSGLRAMNAATARKMDFRQDRMAHASEILKLMTKPGVRWMEIPAHIKYTSDSLKKGNNAGTALSIVWHLFLGRFQG